MVLIGNDDKVNRPKFYGNSGISGTFAFYCPQLAIKFTGTTDSVR